MATILNFGEHLSEVTPFCISCNESTEIDKRKTGENILTYDDCRYKCKKCCIGYSNAQSFPTAIYKNYKDNIPNQLYERLDYILANSLNEENRKNKKDKIAFSSSEDALTWVFFGYFIKYQKTEYLMKLLGFDNEIIDNIYFWGTAYNETEESDDFRKKMEQVLEIDFKENRRYFSEPDIIIKTRTKLIFCEIKLGSGNYNEKSLKEYNRIKAAKYISSDYFFNEEQAHASKCYELIRNWSVLNKMSKGEEVYLLNIGIDRIFDREDEKSYIKNFKSSIKNNTAFIRKKWCVDIVRKINKSDVDDWFYKEITKRFEKYFKK